MGQTIPAAGFIPASMNADRYGFLWRAAATPTLCALPTGRSQDFCRSVSDHAAGGHVGDPVLDLLHPGHPGGDRHQATAHRDGMAEAVERDGAVRHVEEDIGR